EPLYPHNTQSTTQNHEMYPCALVSAITGAAWPPTTQSKGSAMKIKSFSVLVSILVLSQGNSLADYTISVPIGYSLIANHLDNGSIGGNTLDNVLANVANGGVPNGTQIAKYNCDGTYTYYTNNAGVWTPAGGTLNPGEGAYIINNSGNPAPPPFNLTLTGTTHLRVLPPFLPCGCGNYNLLSAQSTNSPSTFEDIMGFPPKSPTQLARFDNLSGSLILNTFSGPGGGHWSGGAPAVNLGESVLIKIPACTATPILTCVSNKAVGGCLA